MEVKKLKIYIGFWDPDGVYFNREGYDRHGGYYDDHGEYIPGEGWDDYNKCYFDENIEDDFDDQNDPDDIDDYYDGMNDDDLLDEENYINHKDIEHINVDNNVLNNMDSHYNQAFSNPVHIQPPIHDTRNQHTENKDDKNQPPKKKSALNALFDDIDNEKKHPKKKK